MPESQRLKLLVITMMYEPDCVGIAAMASDMCSALADRGHDVTVYTTYPYYPEWKLKVNANRWRVKQEILNGVTVRRHRIFVPSNPSSLFPRLIHELSFPLSLLKSLFHRRQFDVVMVYCPLMGGVAFAALRKMLFRDPLWLNIQDIPVEAASASGIIRPGLLARLASLVQRLLFNRADVWSSISPDMIRQLNTMKRPNKPLHLCTNWLTNSLYDRVQQLPPKIGRVPPASPRLLYSGTIGKKQGLLQFCRDLSQEDGNFHFQIRGEGSEAEPVRRWVESQGDDRFKFDKLLPQSEFLNAIHAADWFVIPQKSSVGCSFFPSKLIPSIFTGTPILAISDKDGPLGHEVSENELGLVVPWNSLDGLPNQLDAFRRTPARYKALQENCVKRARSYHRENAIDKFEALLRMVHAQHSAQPVKSWFQWRSNGRVPTA